MWCPVIVYHLLLWFSHWWVPGLPTCLYTAAMVITVVGPMVGNAPMILVSDDALSNKLMCSTFCELV